MQKISSRRELTCKITLENYLSKTPAGLCQSEFLIGESLHNDTSLTPVLLCAGLPLQALCSNEQLAFFLSVDDDNGELYLKFSFLNPMRLLKVAPILKARLQSLLS